MNDYNSLVNSGNVVMIEFYATWCPHCQRMMPVVDQIRELLGNTVKIYQLDVDKNEELCNDLNITGTPTFIIYSRGEKVWEYSGEIDGNVLLQKLQSFES